jgi:hypothetical protein
MEPSLVYTLDHPLLLQSSTADDGFASRWLLCCSSGEALDFGDTFDPFSSITLDAQLLHIALLNPACDVHQGN